MERLRFSGICCEEVWSKWEAAVPDEETKLLLAELDLPEAPGKGIEKAIKFKRNIKNKCIFHILPVTHARHGPIEDLRSRFNGFH